MSTLEIPGFEILEQIGKGGMATVWKARQLSLDRIVAIKVLSSQLSSAADDIERFKTEAQSEAKLKHPGIVQVYDANVESGLCYIVQEYVAGYSVGDWIRSNGRLSEEETLLLAGYVADAMAYAWDEARVIHCDIKPDNVLVDADGTPKVTDLGLARTISIMTEDRISNEVMGTPAYMSPEQVQGLTNLDCRTDIYSLGAMLYHCVTGRVLFQGDTSLTVMKKQLREQLPAPQELNGELSVAICGLIEKMLAKDREDRYQDWNAVRADLARAKRGMPPAEPLARKGLSTVRHTPIPAPLVHSFLTGYVGEASLPRRLRMAATVIGFLIMVVAGVMGGKWGYGRLMERVAAESNNRNTDASADRVATGVESAQQLLAEARSWRAEHPLDYRGAEERYRRVVLVGATTAWAEEAAEELRALRAEYGRSIQKVMASLDDRVTLLLERDAVAEAEKVYTAYDGDLAEETAETRAQRVTDLRTRLADEERRQRVAAVERRQWMTSVLDDVAAGLLSGGVVEGKRILQEAIPKATDPEQVASLRKLRQVLEDAADTDTEIIKSFIAQVGDVVDVALQSGVKRVKIMGTLDGVVKAQLITSVSGASVTIEIRPSDLATAERLARMGRDDAPDVALAKGLMAWRAGAREHARRFFEHTDPMLAGRLVASVDQ